MRLSLDSDDAGFNERLARMAGVRLDGELMHRAITADEEAGEVIVRTDERGPSGSVVLATRRGHVSIVLPIVVICACTSTAPIYMEVEHRMRDARRLRYVSRADRLRGFAGRVLDLRHIRAERLGAAEHEHFNTVLGMRALMLASITPAQAIEQIERGYHGEA